MSAFLCPVVSLYHILAVLSCEVEKTKSSVTKSLHQLRVYRQVKQRFLVSLVDLGVVTSVGVHAGFLTLANCHTPLLDGGVC